MKYRLVAWFAAFAFVVSLLAGMIGGVPLGTVLARGLLGALLFAGLGAATGLVIDRFLPEVSGLETVGGPQEEPPMEGSEVDITLPEERPEGMESSVETTDEVGEETDAEELQPMGSSGYGEDEAAVDEETVEREQAASGTREDVDSLPSLDAFEDVGSTRQEAPERRDSGGGSLYSEELGGDTDPAEAARAVRTWLKRDQE